MRQIKRIFRALIAMAALLSVMFAFAVSAFAAGLFIQSPSVKENNPEIEVYYHDDEDCTAVLIVIPYYERDTLTPEKKQEFIDAYETLIRKRESQSLSHGIERMSELSGVDEDDIACGEFFDIGYTDCDLHELGHSGYFTIKMSADTLPYYVGFMQYDDGEWSLIENAYIDENGLLVFKVEDVSPFAIFVDANAVPSPQTSDSVLFWLIVLLLIAVSGLIVIHMISENKKRRA